MIFFLDLINKKNVYSVRNFPQLKPIRNHFQWFTEYFLSFYELLFKNVHPGGKYLTNYFSGEIPLMKV